MADVLDSAAQKLETDLADQPERKIGLGSVDTGLFFERDLQFFGSAAVQTLEPPRDVQVLIHADLVTYKY